MGGAQTLHVPCGIIVDVLFSDVVHAVFYFLLQFSLGFRRRSQFGLNLVSDRLTSSPSFSRAAVMSRRRDRSRWRYQIGLKLEVLCSSCIRVAEFI